MSSDDILSSLERAAGTVFRRPFDGIIRVELMNQTEAVWVDGRKDPPLISAVSPAGVERQFCLWRLEFSDIDLVLTPDSKRFAANMIAGRVKVSGDMAVMARLEMGDG